jgi:hypothetical protein
MATPKQVLPGNKAVYGDTLLYAHISVKRIPVFFAVFHQFSTKNFIVRQVLLLPTCTLEVLRGASRCEGAASVIEATADT